MSDNVIENHAQPEVFLLFNPAPPCVSVFLCLQTVRHGFPHQPTSLAFDPVQKILAIGSRTGGIRMYPSDPHLVLASPTTSLLFPPTPPSSPPPLPPFLWRPCSDARTLCAAFEPFLHQKLKSGSKFPPAHQPVALLQFISRSHPTPHLHPPPFHPSCCTVTPPSWVFMSWTQN